ncbi:MBL fold metallo-hydrolase [bacterium]|nr:MBL fold metallo-hydrolase [bacterium]
MKFLSIGGGKFIGANSHYLEIDGMGLLLDTGLDPHLDGIGSMPRFDLIQNKIVDAVFVSHCHHDHVGSLPLAIRNFPHARVYMSYVSSFLYTTLLHNAVSVMNILKHEKNISEYPLYTHDDVDIISFIIQGMKLEKEFKLFGHNNPQHGIVCTWHHAGHTLGAGSLYIHAKQGSVFFTGDICASNQFLIQGAHYPKKPVDVLIAECTMGANEETETIKRKNEISKFTIILNETFDKRGSVLIPAFALGKTQEMLWLVNNLKKKKLIPHVDIFVSGLGRAVSRIYDLTIEHACRIDDDFFFDDMEFSVIDSRDLLREGLWVKRPSVIIASSGMMMENTPSYWLAFKMMREARHTICFVGYTSEDSPSRVVLESKRNSKITMPGIQESVDRNCRVERIHFSGHSNRTEIVNMIQTINPSKLVLVHAGSVEALAWTVEKVRDTHPKMEIICPEVGVEYEM